MIELPLPLRVERQLVETPGRTVPMLHGRPDPEAGNDTDVVMVSGFFGTKEDFRELLALLAEAGFRGWAYDYSRQLGPHEDEVSYTISEMAEDLVGVVRAVSAGQPVHVIGHCLGGFVARSAVLQQPGLARSLTLVGCGPSMRERKHQAMLSGLAQIHANGGTIALWPLVKTLLAKDDTIMREFWHDKLSTMNPQWVTGTAESMADEPDRIAELIAAGHPRPGRARQAGPPPVVGRRVRGDGQPSQRRPRDHSEGVAQPQHGAARAAGGRPGGLLCRHHHRRRRRADDGGEVTRPKASPQEAEALRIFLRLIRPAPLADPYPLYNRLRDTAPLLPIRFPGMPGGYLVSTFESCSKLLRDPAFGPPTHAQLDALRPGWRDNAFTRCLYRSMVFRAGPSHRERRQVASPHFSIRQLGTFRAELSQIADVLVDGLAEHEREHGHEPVDLIEHLALPFASLSLGLASRSTMTRPSGSGGWPAR